MPGPTYVLANDPSRCHLFNLGEDITGGGPFAVVQNAYDPEDPRMSDAVFVLLRGGTWIDELALAKLSPERRFDILFETSADAVHALESLSLAGKPNIERFELSETDLRDRVASWQGGGFQQRVEALVESYRASKRP